jgi:hypothetical protein
LLHWGLLGGIEIFPFFRKPGGMMSESRGGWAKQTPTHLCHHFHFQPRLIKFVFECLRIFDFLFKPCCWLGVGVKMVFQIWGGHQDG